MCCCGNIVNPSSLSLGVFLIPGICLRLCFLILRYFLLTIVTLGNFLLVFSVSCEVGADVSAVSSASFLPMCVCSLPGLLPGCYALALVDTRQWTVSFRPHLLLCYEPCEVDSKSFGYTPSVCLATGIDNLYTVMGLPAGWTAVPQGSSVLACWLAPTP